MPRSLKKGPFVDDHLAKKVEVQNVKPGPGGGYRWTVVTGTGDYDAKLVILATGAMGDAPMDEELGATAR